MNSAQKVRLSLLLLTCQLAVGTTSLLAASHPVDSVGVERKEGKKFVLHRVDQGQTLYGVARRYKVTVNDIKGANPDLSDGGVRYDQLLRVPVSDVSLSPREQKDVEKAIRREEKVKAKAAKEAEKLIASAEADDKADVKAKRREERREEHITVKENEGVHVVQTGQTLYSLAVRYSVTMAQLREWNHLGADGIQVGQSLIVNAKAAEKAGLSTKPTEAKPTTAKPKSGGESASARNPVPPAEAAPARLEAKPIVPPEPPLAPGSKPKAKAITPPKPAAETKKEETKKEEAPSTSAEPARHETAKPAKPADQEPGGVRSGRVHSDVGFADVIDGNEPNTKYLALHRSAPVGTLVQVRNDINNQSLYVKVIGKLPDTGINDQVLIRLSARAFEKLSPNGQRFRAEVSYTK